METKETIKLLIRKGLTKTEIEETLSIVIMTESKFLTEDLIDSENFNFKYLLND